MSEAAVDERALLYEDAPCGHVHARPDSTIVAVNRTLLGWTGRAAHELAGQRFQSLLTPAGALLYETHCAPMLRLTGFVGELSLDMLGRADETVPVLLSAVVRTRAQGEQRLQIALFRSPTRREYERELQLARRKAEDTAALLRAQTELLAEHSALLIPIQDDLRVMPVIGAIDAARGRQMLRALLHLDAGAGVRAVLIDLTGVPEIDAAAASTLRQAAAGLRLRGVWPILTGIRPAVASALIADGLDLAGLSVRGTVQDGIALANRRGAR